MSRQGQARVQTIENVKQFLNQEALEWGENPRVTIRDHYFRILEIGSAGATTKGCITLVKNW